MCPFTAFILSVLAVFGGIPLALSALFRMNMGFWPTERSHQKYKERTPSGNTALDKWLTEEIIRLREERRKLDETKQAFTEHVNNEKRAKDQEEFERFRTTL